MPLIILVVVAKVVLGVVVGASNVALGIAIFVIHNILLVGLLLALGIIANTAYDIWKHFSWLLRPSQPGMSPTIDGMQLPATQRGLDAVEPDTLVHPRQLANITQMKNILLTDDLTELLTQFPNGTLHSIVSILKRHSSWSPFPSHRAIAAHAAARDADLKPLAAEIATEILWWGSNDMLRQVGVAADWRSVVAATAKSISVAPEKRGTNATAWAVEEALLAKALADWEKMTPEKREQALRKSGADFDALLGGGVFGAGGILALGGAELLAFIGAEGAGAALAGAVFAPLAIVLGLGWAAFDLAGPGYRVLRPVGLTIAYTRKQLRENWIAASFKD